MSPAGPQLRMAPPELRPRVSGPRISDTDEGGLRVAARGLAAADEKTEELRRESLLNALRQRIREVRQGPDGLLYLLTDEEDGALLRIEPVP